MSNQQPEANERKRWLDDFENVRRVYRWLWIACLVLLVGGQGLLVWARRHEAEHHGFGFERWPGFYALFGFVACVSLVLAARELRKLVMRPEDYYEGEHGD